MNQDSGTTNALKSHEAKVVRGSIFSPLLAVAGLFPAVAFAADLFDLIDTFIFMIKAIVPILIGCAVVIFFWGLVKFIAHADDEKAVTEGKQFMIWGMVGIFVIVALWSIVGFIQTELDIDGGGGGTSPTLPLTLPDL